MASGCPSLFFADQILEKLLSLEDEQLISPALKDDIGKLKEVASAVRAAFLDAEGRRQRHKGLVDGAYGGDIYQLERRLSLVDKNVNDLFWRVRKTKRERERSGVVMPMLTGMPFQNEIKEDREELEHRGRKVFGDGFDNFLDRIKSGEEISIDSFGGDSEGETSYGKTKDEIIQSLIPHWMGTGAEPFTELMENIGRRLLFQNDDDDPDDVAINTLKNIFYFKYSSFYYWDLDVIFSEREQSDISVKWMQSYAPLRLTLKYCFDYCSLFPGDYVIEVATLVKLWMAQGFIIHEDGHADEDVGRRYFEQLLNRGFFQQVESDVLDQSKVTKCRMDSHAFTLSFFTSGPSYVLFRSDHEDLIEAAFHVSIDFHLDSVRKIPRRIRREDSELIRSFLLPCQLKSISDPHHDSGRESVSDLLISKLEGLRALELHDLGIQSLPDYIGGRLKHLRYLDVSRNPDIKLLPNSITELVNLQTLKLSSCVGLQTLPNDMKNLINLRHLEIDGCDSLMCMPPGLGQLTSLRTLSIYVLNDPRELEELGKLNNLTGELQIKKLSTSFGNAFRSARLEDKQHLQSLVLDWSSSSSISDQLEDLKPHMNLKRLTLRGYGGLRLSWLQSLTSLPILVLDSMPNLEYISNEGGGLPMVFPSLRELWLKKLPKLKRWWKDDVELQSLPSFRCLSKLIIQDCPMLDSIPLFPTLEEELTLDSTTLEPFQQTLAMEKTLKRQASPPLSKIEFLGNSHYASLKTLRISNCDVWKSIPLDYFPKLERFDLSKCENFELFTFNLVPETLSWLQLVGLPKFVSFPEGGLPAPKLKEFYIKECKNLRSLPQQMHNLESLEILKIEDCPELVSFPEGGLPAPKLKEFYIKECKNLRSLPQQMHNLESLEILKIEDCPELVSFPEGGLPAPKLKEFYIKECKNLRSLPQQMHNLESLEILKIEDCPELVSFPEGGLPAPKLKEFYIKECKNLRSLPQQMHNLESLEILKIEDCPELVSFPEGGLPAPKLKEFYIKECKNLRSLPQQMHNLESLEILKIEDCPELVSFPEGGLPAPKLKEFYIKECKNLRSLPQQMHNLESLEILKIEDCPELVSFPEGGFPLNIKQLWIECTKLTQLTSVGICETDLSD